MVGSVPIRSGWIACRTFYMVYIVFNVGANAKEGCASENENCWAELGLTWCPGACWQNFMWLIEWREVDTDKCPCPFSSGIRFLAHTYRENKHTQFTWDTTTATTIWPRRATARKRMMVWFVESVYGQFGGHENSGLMSIAGPGLASSTVKWYVL